MWLPLGRTSRPFPAKIQMIPLILIIFRGLSVNALKDEFNKTGQSLKTDLFAAVL